MNCPPPDGLIDTLAAKYFEDLKQAKRTEGKLARAEACAAVKQRALSELIPDPEAADAIAPERWAAAWHTLESRVIRDLILSGVRSDGRDYRTLRPITCSVDLLPRVHGSALFQRGETQALVTVTLGTGRDEQRVDGLVEEYSQKFMLHYYFPPFSVGECRPIRGPGRREIGHGALAERSVEAGPARPRDFPYTIRIISDILESNGSSSMASVCGGDPGPDGRRRPHQQSRGRHLRRTGQGNRSLGPVDRHHRRRGPFRRHGLQDRRNAERHHRHPIGPEDPRHQRGDHPRHAGAIAGSPHRDPPQDAHGHFPAAARRFPTGRRGCSARTSTRRRSAC